MSTFPIDIIIKKLRTYVRTLDVPIKKLESAIGDDPFRIMISIILSARTKDETTAAVTKRLFSIASTPSKIILLPETKLKKLIYPIGFYNVKAKNIKNVARIIHTQYNDTAPKTRAELLDLPGTGRKTANLVLSKAFNIPAICVDTHVHRIPNRWGYIRTKTPFETEMRLQKKLPKKYWIEFNYLLVAYGQSVCTPVSPRCSSCVIREYCKRVGVKKSR